MRKLLTEQLVAKGIAAPELPDPPPFTPTRRSSWTSPDSVRSFVPPDSAPTTPAGCSSRLLTPWASRLPTTVPVR